MEKGKIIVIEGTDCSGKETQSKLLIDKLNKEGLETVYMSFPMYDTTTGKIVGLPFLGKPYLAQELIDSKKQIVLERIQRLYGKYNSETNSAVEKALEIVAEELATGWFSEGAPNVDPMVSSLYYIADRKYNLPVIEEAISDGKNVVLDRYTYSNMAHQGSKIIDSRKRTEMYEWIRKMEFEMMGLPESDVRVFLHMPNQYAYILRKNRDEALDENERDSEYMLRSENAYVEVANMFDFETISCVEKRHEEVLFEDIKTPEQINNELYEKTIEKIKRR